MANFLIKRLLQAIFVLFSVTLIVAFAIRLTGDPALMLTQGAGSISEADLVNIREALGINKSFTVQYIEFIQGLFSGDFGKSFMGGTPVSQLIGISLPATLFLAFSVMIVSILISIPLGIQAAIKRNTWIDQAIRIFSLIGLSFPNFWLALMLVLLFSINLQWLPPSGMSDWSSFILPAVTMAIILTATNVRLVRTSMLETLQAQYIMVARAKGLSENKVLYKHALRNCAIPLITYFGLQFGGLLGGIVIIERIFNWPGLGTLAFEAVSARDYPVLQAVITILSMLIVGVNLLVDIAYGLIDPRIRNGVENMLNVTVIFKRDYSLFKNLEFVLGFTLTATMCVLVLSSDVIFDGLADKVNLTARLIEPFSNSAHLLGTDPLGRDVLARVVAGGAVSLQVGFLSVFGAVILGVFMGLISGYFRGFWDIFVMRFADVQLALPFILLAITFIAIVGGGLTNMIVLLIVSQWVQYARLVRSSVLSLRDREYIQSAQAIGVSHFNILFRHLLPNLIGPVIVLMTLNVANNILLESSLTFLGLGVDPLTPSWGGMLANGRTYIQTAWWVTLFPGVAILLTVLGMNLLGDWLRDTLDPTGRTSR
ncbi:ABC transporter permease subunit [Psychromonas sp. KJ10-10]|uniref:ABC transporter permease subunit n=1 Tax=Psychromonas sp. KJ10-10 TaxID=3391823 RepID=UPI0039B513F1